MLSFVTGGSGGALANTATDKYLGIAPYLAVSGDWSAAINQAMADLSTTGGNIHGNGIYNCNGTPLDPSGGNAILLAPVIPSSAGETHITINFIGGQSTTPNGNAYSGMTLATTNNTAGVSLFGGYSATSWGGYHFTAVKMVFTHVNFSLTGTLANGLNAEWINALELHDVLIVGNLTNSGTQPGSATGGTGLATPLLSNNFEIVLDRVGLFGWPLGALIHEHTQLDNVSVANSYNGIQFDAQGLVGNSIGGSNIWMQTCINYILGGTGRTDVQISRLDIESDTLVGVNILDASGNLSGSIAYKKSNGLTGPVITTSGTTRALALFSLDNGWFDYTPIPPPAAIEEWFFQENQGVLFANSGYDFTNGMTGTNTTQATATGFPGKVTTYNGTTSVSNAASATNTSFDGSRPFSISATVSVDTSVSGEHTIVSNIDSATGNPGYSLRYLGQSIEFYLGNTFSGSNYIYVISTHPCISANTLARICVTYDGSKTAAGVALFVNGVAQPLNINIDTLTGSTASTFPVRVGAEEGATNFAKGAIGNVRIWNRQLTLADSP